MEASEFCVGYGRDSTISAQKAARYLGISGLAARPEVARSPTCHFRLSRRPKGRSANMRQHASIAVPQLDTGNPV